MLRWNTSGSRLESFLYLPIWEVIFGILLMLVAVLLPVLFLTFNGIQVKQYPEWLFCLGFLGFFLYLGHTLAFQWFEGKLSNGNITIHHNLRGPDFHLERPTSEWGGLKKGELRDESGKFHTTLFFLAKDGTTEIYRSVSAHEVNSLLNALETLRKSIP
ncbi:MAG: hypothetical protein WA705_24380 [Candidatus Ozemobacteraceae bacterium]